MSHYYCSVAVAATILVIANLHQPSKLAAIPTVGSSSLLGSWWAGFRFLNNGLDVVQKGYEKHKGNPFKVAEFHRWTVVLSSREHVEELCRAPDDVLSFNDALDEEFATRFTMGPEVHHSSSIIRSKLTQNIAAMYSEMKAELVIAFDDLLDLRGNEWKAVPAWNMAQGLVCRTSGRVLVGPSLCRDPEWIDFIIQHAVDIVKAAAIIGLFPECLKLVAARFFTNMKQTNQRAREFIQFSIEEQQKANENECANKSSNLLSCLMESQVEGMEISVQTMTAYILAANFATIHATSSIFTHVLFHLAAHPYYVQPLREEVQGIVEKEGWSKNAVGKMHKIDSFIKEVHRREGGIGMIRKALKDYTFADGTIIPKGSIVVVPARPVHYDDTIYPNANAFQPFRFSEIGVNLGERAKHQYVVTNADYLPFGHGRHACPGRFFAAAQLKSLLAHVVMAYDVKLEGATLPESLHVAMVVVPNPSVKVMFRRRVD